MMMKLIKNAGYEWVMTDDMQLQRTKYPRCVGDDDDEEWKLLTLSE
jgi:hypothetical protein